MDDLPASVFPGFRIRNLALSPHRCALPSPRLAVQTFNLQRGTVLECETCEAQYLLDHEQRDGWYWMRLLGRDKL